MRVVQLQSGHHWKASPGCRILLIDSGAVRFDYPSKWVVRPTAKYVFLIDAYGTIRIGMKRPDVFSSMYIMSACCLMNNPRPPAPAATAATPPAAPAAPAAAPAGARGGGGFANAPFAEAAAWSANPNNPPKFYDEPVKDGVLQQSVVAKWLANSPLAMLEQYGTNLKKYKAIAGDVGLQDSLLATNRQMDQMMKDMGVAHTFETYEGDHTSRVPQRIEEKVLPFFSRNLASQ